MKKQKPTRKDKFQQAAGLKQQVTSLQKKPSWLPGLIIALTGFVLYVNTAGHGFTLDDYSIILENRVTRQGSEAIGEIFKTSYRHGYYFTDDNLYRPVVKAMFALEWEFSPGDATLGHIMNIVFYSLTGWFLFQLLMRISSGNVMFAFISSLLFIAHPIHTEVVANIKSRDEILAFLFCITALERFIFYLKSGKTHSLFVAAFLYLVALLSKESAITFVAVFPLAGWFFSPASGASLIKKYLPLLGTAILFLLIRKGVLGDQIPESVSVADNLLMAAKQPGDRFATAVFILLLYLKLLVFPHPLVFDYSYNQIPVKEPSDPLFIFSLLLHTGLLLFAILKFRTKSLPVFGILFYFITLSISSNIFITIGSSMGERFVYMPSLGFCMVAGYILSAAFKISKDDAGTSLQHLFKKNWTVTAIIAVVIAGFSIKTIARNPVWKDNYTLYSNDVNLSPNSTRTHYYLGNYLIKPEAWSGKGEEEKNKIIRKGISELEKSIAIYPYFSDAHLQLGVAYFKLNKPDNALASYQRALKLNPGYASIHNNIGTVYFTGQNYTEALKYFLEAIRLDPRYAEAHANAGSTYGMLQQYDQALSYLFNAVKYDPGYAQAYYFIGLTYRFKGDEQNANAYLEKAYKLDPSLRPKS